MVPALPLAAIGRVAGDACGRGAQRGGAGAAAAEQVHTNATARRLGRGAPAWGLRVADSVAPLAAQVCEAGPESRKVTAVAHAQARGQSTADSAEPAVEHVHLQAAAWSVATRRPRGLIPQKAQCRGRSSRGFKIRQPQSDGGGRAQARGQGAADSAEALARLAPGSTTEVMQELYAFLNHLNISGLGLVAATERSPLVSLLVSARPRNP